MSDNERYPGYRTKGRFESHQELLEDVCHLHYNSRLSDGKIAKITRTSVLTVSGILSSMGALRWLATDGHLFTPKGHNPQDTQCRIEKAKTQLLNRQSMKKESHND
jgi:hypothetical protein